jgi:hypothetical protein
MIDILMELHRQSTVVVTCNPMQMNCCSPGTRRDHIAYSSQSLATDVDEYKQPANRGKVLPQADL